MDLIHFFIRFIFWNYVLKIAVFYNDQNYFLLHEFSNVFFIFLNRNFDVSNSVNHF
ncbi:hypothetical protein J2Z57_001557 [Formosa algae]|uniref:Uncharacterized protein n=1 Tax=Formosa algae TaxID=225843 RepID=A0A9X0YKJ2_9FLAO|nr:hypothetical protein [Formosa algae]MDQ0335111.1 hypothetical protein [Formosa algae]